MPPQYTSFIRKLKTKTVSCRGGWEVYGGGRCGRARRALTRDNTAEEMKYASVEGGGTHTEEELESKMVRL